MTENVPLDGNLKSPPSHDAGGQKLISGQPTQRREDVSPTEPPGGYHTDEGAPGKGNAPEVKDDSTP